MSQTKNNERGNGREIRKKKNNIMTKPNKMLNYQIIVRLVGDL